MRRPCCILIIDADKTDKNEQIPKVSIFPRLDIKTVNKILNDVIDLDLEEVLTLIEKGNTRILGEYLIYKFKNHYTWKRIKEDTELPQELIENWIPIRR